MNEKNSATCTTTTYDKPNGKFVVKSHFSDEYTMSELIYQIISKNAENAENIAA